MRDASVRFPGPATLQWVAQTAGGIHVVGGRRMTGGLTSSVHRLTVADRNGARRHLVLRRWVQQELATGQRLAVEEVRVLEALSGQGFPAPGPVGLSDGSETDGVAAVLMTRVPGRLSLTPGDPDSWLKQMAELAPRLHALGVVAPPVKPPAARPPLPKPDWIKRRDIWDAAQKVLAGPPPMSPHCFIHTDFQHFNMLWRRDRLTGIVDWTWPKLGPPDFDVGHCRLNLAVLHSAEWAEKFRMAYEANAGRKVEPWYDLHRLTAFSTDWQGFIPLQVAGRAQVDIAGMPGRVEELIASVLKRV